MFCGRLGKYKHTTLKICNSFGFPCLHDGIIMYEYTCLIQYVGQNKSITNRAPKKWECGGKKLKSGIEAEERIDVTTKTTFLPYNSPLQGFRRLPRAQNSCRRTNLNSSFRIFCSLKRVLLVYHDHYWMTEHGRGEGSILVSLSILVDGTWEEREMVQKENNILIDETRTDLRQGFQGIHQSSSFVPHLVSCSQSLSHFFSFVI